MAKASKAVGRAKGFENLNHPESLFVAGPGGGAHQTADGAQASFGEYIEGAKQQHMLAREAHSAESGA
jgi:hypothetical protein